MAKVTHPHDVFGKKTTLLERIQKIAKTTLYASAAVATLTGAIGYGYSEITRTPSYLLRVDLDRNLTIAYSWNGVWQRQFEVPHTDGQGGYPKEREGDLKTPTGTYTVDAWIGNKATINYPNKQDQLHGRTGRGIQLLSIDDYADRGRRLEAIARGEDATNGSIQYLPRDYERIKSFLEQGALIEIGVNL